MADVCAVCGKRLGGVFGGIEGANNFVLSDCTEAGIEHPSPICHICIKPYSRKAELLISEKNTQNGKHATAEPPQLPIYTINPYPYGSYEFIGLVSAYVALGTGLVSGLLSSVSDFFGQESGAYNEKMTQATAACIIKLRRSALDMGANAVIGLQTTFTELTAGHGQIMVAMIGTAVKTQAQDAADGASSLIVEGE